MPARHGEPSLASLPSPFPEGWYFVATLGDVRKAGLIHRPWMGVDVVAWAGDAGRVCVAEAVCPHLGSDISPETGGAVCEGRLVCPFHGFEFDTTGQCIDTPYASPPRSARLRTFESRVIAGLIFAWWGSRDRPPQWGMPEEEPRQDGWSKVLTRSVTFPGHPQETTENVVDIAHLRYVHGYGEVARTAPVTVDGAFLDSRWDFRTVRGIGPLSLLTFNLSASASIYGLGYSFVEVHEHSIGMDLRLWVLATPVDGTVIEMTLATQVRDLPKPGRRIVGLGFLPTRVRAPILNWFMAAQQMHDVRQDVPIWSRKHYVSPPRLNRSDGEVTMFRAYCAQFYPDSQSYPDSREPAAAAAETGEASRSGDVRHVN